jgi:hypothetical protein
MVARHCKGATAIFLWVSICFIAWAAAAIPPGQNKPTASKLPFEEFRIVGRVLASPDPLMHASTLDCHVEEFLFGVESIGTGAKKLITPVEIANCYHGNEQPLPDAFFDHSKLYQLRVARICGGDSTFAEAAFATWVDTATGKEKQVMGMQMLKGAPKHLLKPDLVLPCYVLLEYEAMSGHKQHPATFQPSFQKPRTSSPE